MRRAILVLAVGLGGCSDVDSWHDQELGQDQDFIVNGSLDTTHQAVVAWLHGSKCSATIIDADPVTGIGHALTAGHCVPGSNGNLRQGNSHSSNYVQYPVIAKEAHPEYGTGIGLTEAYDIAVVTFSGATAATPVIGVLTPQQDNLGSGTQVDMVGYGNTEDGGTSQRHHVIKPIAALTSIELFYDQSMSGMCSGDSGGPSLVTVQGDERVAGVHSRAGNGTSCTGSMAAGIDIRASAFWNTFIAPTINGQPPTAQSCDQCTRAHTAFGVDADCEAEVITCADNAACAQYENCLSACTTQLCVNQCDQQHPFGSQLYADIIDCLCTSACDDECASASLCNPPACGLSFTDGDCDACLESSCCTQVQNCSVDQECYQCFSSPLAAGCDTDPETQALMSCAETACASACDFSIGPGSGGMGGAGGGSEGPGGAAVGGAPPSSGAGEPVASEDDEVAQSCACRAVGDRGGSARWPLWLAALVASCLGLRRAGRRWT